MLGAVFVDGSFRPTATLHVFDHLIRPFIDTYISPTTVSVDSIRQLLEVAQSHSCGSIDHRATIVEMEVDDALPAEYQPRQTRADVVMHGLVVASAVMPNAKTAKRIASAKARDYLLANVDFFLEHCASVPYGGADSQATARSSVPRCVLHSLHVVLARSSRSARLRA